MNADQTALVALAETLDSARIQANAINATAPQSGVYGKTEQGLKEVLAFLVTDSVEDTYQAILDGNTVRQALALGL